MAHSGGQGGQDLQQARTCRDRETTQLRVRWPRPTVRGGTLDCFALLRFCIELTGHVAQVFRRAKTVTFLDQKRHFAAKERRASLSVLILFNVT